MGLCWSSTSCDNSLFEAVLNAAMLAADSAGRPDRALRLLRAAQHLGVEANVLSIVWHGESGG